MAGRWKIEIVGHIPENDYSLKAEIMVSSAMRGLRTLENIELFENSINHVEIYEKQTTVPVETNCWRKLWLYRNAIVKVVRPFGTNADEVSLRIKHYFLLKDKELSKVKREVEAFENMERLPSERRERIPDDVRLFVWQRDKGCCIKCGSRERLEFDHIIPVAEGGSNTARNIELLCETHNRQKGKNI